MKQNYEEKMRSLKEQLELSKVMASVEGYSSEAFEKPSPSSDCDVSSNKDKIPDFKSQGREPPFGSSNPLLIQNNLERLQQPLTIDTSSSISLDQLRMIPRGECEVSPIDGRSITSLAVVYYRQISLLRDRKVPQPTFQELIITTFRLSNFLAQASIRILSVSKKSMFDDGIMGPSSVQILFSSNS